MKKLVSITLVVMVALVFGFSGVYAEDQAQKQAQQSQQTQQPAWTCPRMNQAGCPWQGQGPGQGRGRGRGARFANCPRMTGQCPWVAQQQNTAGATAEQSPGASNPESGKTEAKGR